MNSAPHILFVCSRNQWRSPTAEKVFSRRDDIFVRSRGLARSARRKLTNADVSWADMIFVMEDEQQKRIVENFGESLEGTPIVSLDIPDEFRFMDPQLIEMIECTVNPILNNYFHNLSSDNSESR